VDAWPFAVDTYRRNFASARAVQLALHKESGPDDLPAIGKIDLLLASPECTNHTCARGSRTPDEGSKQTARYVLNFARELAPRWVVIENVLHMKGWHGYDPLVKELKRLDYNVLPQELDASQFGVAQKRRRLFLLCDRQAHPRSVPLRAGKPRSGRSILDPSSRWKSKPVGPGTHAKGTLERIRRGIAALGRGVPFLVVYYGSDGAGGWHPLDRPLRTLTTLDRFGLVSWDGNTPMLRMLQVPELKRAMGFDDEYLLEDGSRRDRIKILGNGVCPPVMKAIVETLTGVSAMSIAA
jgi:DNA (cytosine-5)-methyltransferase 1